MGWKICGGNSRIKNPMIIFNNTSIKGVFTFDQLRNEDSRGYFARTFCTTEFTKAGFNFSIDQISTSFNPKAGTLRGMHYQIEPYSEIKIVRCTRGAIYDVVLDLRVTSETYLMWLAFELNADNGKSLFVPRGCAHGFQTLQDDTEVLYTNNGLYSAEYSRTVRWDDPAFNIYWPPCGNRVMSSKDRLQNNFIK
jgi:dTDP-4-dehydrorhamnose 3,5-epimerase